MYLWLKERHYPLSWLAPICLHSHSSWLHQHCMGHLHMLHLFTSLGLEAICGSSTILLVACVPSEDILALWKHLLLDIHFMLISKVDLSSLWVCVSSRLGLLHLLAMFG